MASGILLMGCLLAVMIVGACGAGVEVGEKGLDLASNDSSLVFMTPSIAITVSIACPDCNRGQSLNADCGGSLTAVL